MDTPESFQAKFDNIIGLMHRELDNHASNLYNLYVAEINKLNANLSYHRPSFGSSDPHDVAVPQSNNAGLLIPRHG